MPSTESVAFPHYCTAEELRLDSSSRWIDYVMFDREVGIKGSTAVTFSDPEKGRILSIMQRITEALSELYTSQDASIIDSHSMKSRYFGKLCTRSPKDSQLLQPRAKLVSRQVIPTGIMYFSSKSLPIEEYRILMWLYG